MDTVKNLVGVGAVNTLTNRLTRRMTAQVERERD